MLLNRKILKFHRSSLEEFGVTMKAFSDLVMLNQYCQAALKAVFE